MPFRVPWRPILAAVGALAVIFCVFAYTAQSSWYLLLPDTPHPVAPIVEVQGGHTPGPGDIYYVDVLERRATWAERYLPFLRKDDSLLSPEELGPGTNDKQRHQYGVVEMMDSKTAAEAVALSNLGYHVSSTFRITRTIAGSPAAKVLRPGDLIVAVDGHSIPFSPGLRGPISHHSVGSIVQLAIIRAKKTLQIRLHTYAIRKQPHKSLIGVFGSELVGKLPIKIEINSGEVIGPSAGLAFALELTDRLGPDISRGYSIAVTGELWPDGSVHAIGGVEQKVIGARRAGIEVMLLPAGENAREARQYAGGMKILAVKSFQQALRVLATLPVKK